MKPWLPHEIFINVFERKFLALIERLARKHHFAIIVIVGSPIMPVSSIVASGLTKDKSKPLYQEMLRITSEDLEHDPDIAIETDLSDKPKTVN